MVFSSKPRNNYCTISPENLQKRPEQLLYIIIRPFLMLSKKTLFRLSFLPLAFFDPLFYMLIDFWLIFWVYGNVEGVCCGTVNIVRIIFV